MSERTARAFREAGKNPKSRDELEQLLEEIRQSNELSAEEVAELADFDIESDDT